jgi:hypothetical protein
VRLRVTKTFKHQKTQGLGALLEKESGRKEGVFWPTLEGRKRGGEELLIPQTIRILNPSWYSISFMHLIDSLLYYLMDKLHDFSL